MCAPYTSQTGSANHAEDRRSSPKRIHLQCMLQSGFCTATKCGFFPKTFPLRTRKHDYWDILRYCELLWYMSRYESLGFFQVPGVSKSLPGSYLQVTTCWCGLPSLRAPPLCWDLFGESWKMQQDEFNLYSSNWTWHHFVIEPLRCFSCFGWTVHLYWVYSVLSKFISDCTTRFRQSEGMDPCRPFAVRRILTDRFQLLSYLASPASFVCRNAAIFCRWPTSGIHATNWIFKPQGMLKCDLVL